MSTTYGVIDWVWHNGELATLTGKLTRKVHTHEKRWNLLPPAYGAMW